MTLLTKFFLITLSIFFTACSLEPEFIPEKVKFYREQSHESYLFRAENFGKMTPSLTEKIQPAPEKLLKFLSEKYGENLYPYTLRKTDLQTFVDSFKLLPKYLQYAVKSKVLRIYFVYGINFSSIQTSFATLTPDGRLYNCVVLNAKLFTESFDAGVFGFDAKYFHTGRYDPKKPRKLHSILITLLWFALESYNFTYHLTPYVSSEHLTLLARVDYTNNPIVSGIWFSSTTISPLLSDLQNLSFQSIQASTDLNQEYKDLLESPFVTFEAAYSWNDDVYTLLLVDHLHTQLKIPYTMQVKDPPNLPNYYLPLENPKVKKRLKYLRQQIKLNEMCRKKKYPSLSIFTQCTMSKHNDLTSFLVKFSRRLLL
ncbi:MAG: hypothetical protein AAF518_19420 [Spirochaetota bacterium]